MLNGKASPFADLTREDEAMQSANDAFIGHGALCRHKYVGFTLEKHPN